MKNIMLNMLIAIVFFLFGSFANFNFEIFKSYSVEDYLTEKEENFKNEVLNKFDSNKYIDEDMLLIKKGLDDLCLESDDEKKCISIKKTFLIEATLSRIFTNSTFLEMCIENIRRGNSVDETVVKLHDCMDAYRNMDSETFAKLRLY